MEFVVNEWLPEYFKPGTSLEEKKYLESFLNQFLQRNDKIYIRRPSEFLNKIYRYSKQYHNFSKSSREISKFIKIVLLDSNRCFFVDDDEFQLSENIRNKLIEGGNTVSDTYLFEAASLTDSKIILTTDVKLKNLLQDDEFFKVELLESFMATY
jgi:hypothetical protein